MATKRREKGALKAQIPAQQDTALISGESQTSTQDVILPSDMRNDANARATLPDDSREWMGIEPTWSFVQTPRWF